MGKEWVQDIMEVDWMELGDKLHVEDAVNDKTQASDPCNSMLVPIHPSPQGTATEKSYSVCLI